MFTKQKSASRELLASREELIEQTTTPKSSTNVLNTSNFDLSHDDAVAKVQMSLKTVYDDLFFKHAQIVVSNQDASKRLEQANDKIKNLHGEINKLNDDKNDLHSKLQESQSDVTGLKKRSKELTQDIWNSQKKLEGTQDQIKSLETELSRIYADRDKLKSEVTKLIDEVNQSKKHI